MTKGTACKIHRPPPADAFQGPQTAYQHVLPLHIPGYSETNNNPTFPPKNRAGITITGITIKRIKDKDCGKQRSRPTAE